MFLVGCTIAPGMMVDAASVDCAYIDGAYAAGTLSFNVVDVVLIDECVVNNWLGLRRVGTLSNPY